MVDPYSMLMQMAVEGKPAEEIAKATGWPTDAVSTMIDELAANNDADMDVMYFDGSDDEDAHRRWR